MVIQNETRSDSKERPKQNPIDSESLIKLKMLLQGPPHGSDRHIDDRKGINVRYTDFNYFRQKHSEIQFNRIFHRIFIQIY